MYSGTGIYSLPEASKLIGVEARKIHRWLYGYSYAKQPGKSTERSFSGPLWQPQLSKEEFEAEVIGFNDLLELRFVAAFVSHGVPLIVVRRCLDNARTALGVDYPMTSGSFKTDGKTIFADAVAESVSEGALLDLKSLQYAFKEVVRPSLYAGIEYEGQRATRWYPQDGRRQIVLDPSRDFGSPILEKTGTPTSVLYASFLAEGESSHALAQTARIYEAPLRLVETAVRFERGLRRPVH